MRNILKWKYAGWSVGVFGGAALTAALAEKFNLAYFFALITAIVAIGSWLASDVLGRRKRNDSFRIYVPDDDRKAPRDWRFRIWQILPSLVIAALAVCTCLWIHTLKVERELLSLDGTLYPDTNLVSSDHISFICKPRTENELIVMAGGNGYAVDAYPASIISIDGDPLLLIDRDTNGNVSITAKIIGKDDKLVVKIDHGHYLVNRNNYMSMDRLKRQSILTVTDQFDNEVLYLHLATKNILILRAIIYDNRLSQPIVITGTDVIGLWGWGQSPSKYICFTNFKTAVFGIKTR